MSTSMMMEHLPKWLKTTAEFKVLKSTVTKHLVDYGGHDTEAVKLFTVVIEQTETGKCLFNYNLEI